MRDISCARTWGGQNLQRTTTEQAPVLNENTLCHAEAPARSTPSSPSCRDAIKMSRSCSSWLADQPHPAMLFNAGHGLWCQVLSNQLSCFSGGKKTKKKFFFPFLFWGCFVQSFAPLVEFCRAPGPITHTTDRGFSLEINVIASIYHFNSLMKVRCN